MHTTDDNATGANHQPGKDFKEPKLTEWVTAIEYLKAKSTYDAFTDNFGQVNFDVARFH